MKSKGYLGVVLVVAFTLLVGCQKPTPAQESAEAFVNAIVYNKAVDQLPTMFDIESKGVKEEAENRFVSEKKESLALDETYDQKLREMFVAMEKNTEQETSYTAKVLKEDRGKAKVELTIIGLAEIDEEQFAAVTDAELAKVTADLTAETTEEEMAKVINDVSFAVIDTLSQERQATTTPTKLTMEMMVDSADKSKWVIQNQDRFVIDLLDAFGQ